MNSTKKVLRIISDNLGFKVQIDKPFGFLYDGGYLELWKICEDLVVEIYDDLNGEWMVDIDNDQHSLQTLLLGRFEKWQNGKFVEADLLEE